MKTKNRLFPMTVILFAVMLVLMFVICRVKVNASVQDLRETTDSLETAFRKNISAVLKDYGIKNAGITMSKLSIDGENTKYEVSIYMPEYISLSDREAEKLESDLAGVSIGIRNASVSFCFTGKE